MRVRRPLLLPLVPVYAAALRLEQLLLERSSAGQRRLASSVVSVGSLSAGGAGKTPVVQAIATLLMRHGYAVDVLSRGYGRGSKAVERVDPAGIPERYGDEPLLLARQTSAPVYVSADRHAAGLLAEKEIRGENKLVHLLDDGFQHRRLARDLDVVLVTQQDVQDCLLPAGNLREPLNRLRRADVLVLRTEEEAGLRPVVVKFTSSATPLWIIRRELHLPEACDMGAIERPVAFCGIARPKSFFAMLRTEGLDLADSVVFRDHHAYREHDMRRLLAVGRRTGAGGFITTEKDAVKLPATMRAQLQAIGPLIIAELKVAFLDEHAVLTRIGAAQERRGA